MRGVRKSKQRKHRRHFKDSSVSRRAREFSSLCSAIYTMLSATVVCSLCVWFMFAHVLSGNTAGGEFGLDVKVVISCDNCA